MKESFESGGNRSREWRPELPVFVVWVWNLFTDAFLTGKSITRSIEEISTNTVPWKRSWVEEGRRRWFYSVKELQTVHQRRRDSESTLSSEVPQDLVLILVVVYLYHSTLYSFYERDRTIIETMNRNSIPVICFFSVHHFITHSPIFSQNFSFPTRRRKEEGKVGWFCLKSAMVSVQMWRIDTDGVCIRHVSFETGWIAWNNWGLFLELRRLFFSFVIRDQTIGSPIILFSFFFYLHPFRDIKPDLLTLEFH